MFEAWRWAPTTFALRRGFAATLTTENVAPEVSVKEVSRDGLQEDALLVPDEVQVCSLMHDNITSDGFLVVQRPWGHRAPHHPEPLVDFVQSLHFELAE